MDTNVRDLPWPVLNRLVHYLNANNSWHILADQLPAQDALSSGCLSSLSASASPAQGLLSELGARAYNLRMLLVYLDKCQLVQPQLLLKRKFAPVKLRGSPRKEECASMVRLSCRAIGFPYPSYEWAHRATGQVLSNSNTLQLAVCGECSKEGEYECRVSNAVPFNEDWTADYAKRPPTSSRLVTHPIHVKFPRQSDLSMSVCERCQHERTVQRVQSALQMDTHQDILHSAHALAPLTLHPTNQYTHSHTLCQAVDKVIHMNMVALIICNSEYEHLPKLLTPPCDAQTLADALLALDFKTVTLADLTLHEMKSLIREYAKLLGASGVYAVFYFVGHGFEHGGKCYLLPVDAPNEEYTSEHCISVDWVLCSMQQHKPYMNLILLDMCRRCPPHNIEHFLSTAEHWPPGNNRNTVFGYATSLGEGAFEVKGETNGIFMKYLKKYLTQPPTVIEMLNRVMRDLEKDSKAGQVQFPELRSNLSRPCSLGDIIISDGHTRSLDLRTHVWQSIHELPDPVNMQVPDHGLNITVWFDYCGHFCNMVFMFTSVTQLLPPSADSGLVGDTDQTLGDDPFNATHSALCSLAKPVELSNCTKCTDADEGVSMRMLLKCLQKSQEPLVGSVTVVNDTNNESVCTIDIHLDKLLIMRL